ncbi:hypothetical protein DM860_011614 [Cuscuta australis]|uniref:Ubiquitin thioesterase OTU n=1 Tax=Cuscuta australis TaxID=267555 RepID=A0A328D3I9_9ASTE|nr:hypothetical protein DM860_011614 [Cuscuta australis]
MATPLPNHTVLDQLRTGTAQFEILSSPSPSTTNTIQSFQKTNHNSPSFFARIRPPFPPPAKEAERYRVEKVAGDGRCLFRALVKGMARNKGIITLTPRQERDDADELRAAVKEVICEDPSERLQYQDAVIAITIEEPLRRYCQRIGRSDFWGGESELLVLSKLCRQRIVVYIPANEGRRSGGSGFIPIAEYGNGWGKREQPRQVVRLLYSGGNHYDLLAS